MIYSFSERLEFSKGAKMDSDAATINSLVTGCVSVHEAPVDLDVKGVDYVATLRGGAEVYVDVKTRSQGCSKYWSAGPEVAIETWSVLPGGKYQTSKGKAGWTLDESKITDLILYTFYPDDCTTAFLFPFQHLRMASRKMLQDWMTRYKVDIQDSGSWESKAVFVPVDEVVSAINDVMAFGRSYDNNTTKGQ